MEIYQIHPKKYIIVQEKVIYYIWDTSLLWDNGIIVNKFLRKGKQNFELCIPSRDGYAEEVKDWEDTIKYFYQKINTYPKINPKQLLTYPNPKIREIIRKLLNESI